MNPWDNQSGRLFDPSGIFHTLQACGKSGQQCDGVVIALHIQQDPISSESVTPCIGGQGQATAGVVYAIQGNAIDRADTAGCNGCGWREGACYTLNTVDRPAIAFMDKQGAKARSIGAAENCSPTLKACSSGVPSVVFPTIARTLTAETDASPCVDRGQNIVAIDRGECFVASSFGGYVKSNPTLRAAGGDLGGGSEGIVVYDAKGNGSGTLVPTLTGDHGNRVTDYTALIVNSTGGGVAGTLDGSYWKGTGARNGLEREIIAQRAPKPPRRYIVRRLTPTECQRLQGFPDGWGAPDKKADMEDDEAEFWASVRKTYAEITKKRYAPYKKRSALIKWYNKLHSDGAEYKMWGNGISLPCAVYVLQGIVRCAQEVD